MITQKHTQWLIDRLIQTPHAKDNYMYKTWLLPGGDYHHFYCHYQYFFFISQKNTLSLMFFSAMTWVILLDYIDIDTMLIPQDIFRNSSVRTSFCCNAFFTAHRVKGCYNGVQYSTLCITYCRDWGRISTKCWISKRHPLPRPDRRAMRCFLWIFVRKLTAL